MEGEIITKEKHHDIYDWLSKNVYNYYYYTNIHKSFSLTKEGKINAYCSVDFRSYLTEFKYPFGYVEGYFNCSDCKSLMSFIGFPEKIDGYFNCYNCNSLTSFIGFPKHITFIYKN